eukprot:6569148-Alexandrium_andersonii.AAC.1
MNLEAKLRRAATTPAKRPHSSRRPLISWPLLSFRAESRAAPWTATVFSDERPCVGQARFPSQAASSHA